MDIKNAIMLKTKIKKNYLKLRIKTRKTLIENKTSSNKKLLFAGNCFLPVFTEAAPEVERNKIKYWQS